MEIKVIIFLVNAWHGGPYLGIAGAKVRSCIHNDFVVKTYFSRFMELFPSYQPCLPSGPSPAWRWRDLGLSARKVCLKTIIVHHLSHLLCHLAGYQGARKRKLKLLILVIWSSSSLLSLAPLLGCNQYAYEGYLLSSTVDYLSEVPAHIFFNCVLFSIAWVGPSIVIFYSHIKILKANRWDVREDLISITLLICQNKQSSFVSLHRRNQWLSWGAEEYQDQKIGETFLCRLGGESKCKKYKSSGSDVVTDLRGLG